MKRRSVVLAGGLAFAILALAVAGIRGARRAIVVPHGRAVILDPSLAGRPNAADLYQQALPLAESITKEQSAAISAALRRPWSDPDGSLAALLQQQAPLLALARQAASLPRFEAAAGLGVIDMNTPVPQMAGAVQGGKLLLLDGRRLLGEGHADEALNDALAVLMMAGQCDREKNFALLGGLISNLLVIEAFPLVSDLVAAGLDEPRLALLRSALQPLAETIDVGRGERQELVMQGAALGGISFKAWYIPPSTLRKMILDAQRAYGVYADAVADGARRNDPGIQKAETTRRRIYGERPATKENILFCNKIGMKNPQAFGDCVIAYPFTSTAPDYSAVIAKAHFARSQASVLLAAVGVRLYELSRHAPPPTLQDLVPGFLPRVPVDDFDGFQPLRYVLGRDSWTVYGFGPDRKDDGGAPRLEVDNEDWLNPVKGDVVVTAGRLRFAPPPRRTRARSSR